MENDSLLAALTPLGGGEALVAAACNRATARYGLVLSESDVQALAVSRREALRDTGAGLLRRRSAAQAGSGLLRLPPHRPRQLCGYTGGLAVLFL